MSLAPASHLLPAVIFWAGIIPGSIDLCAALAFVATRAQDRSLSSNLLRACCRRSLRCFTDPEGNRVELWQPPV